MEISKEQIAKMAESYKKAETQHVAQRAVTKNGILESAESVEVLKRMSPKNFAFSIDVDDQAVANQKMSGRCWMFACLNVLRFHIEKELDLPKGTFELSQAYLAFFNKLERAAWFLEHVVATADKPLDDREVDWLFTTPMADGGDWDMVCALVKKYGVVPHEAQAETHCTNNTAELNTVLSHLLRQDALKLRTMAQEDKDTKATQEEMLSEVYRVLAVCFGEPVQKFDFTYNDAKGHYHADLGITPLEFLKKYVPIDLDDYIGVINVPGDDKPYGRMYAIQDSDQIPERRNLYLNVPMEELKGYVIDSLKDGEPVWFGSDVLQHCDRNAGVMDFDLYDLEAHVRREVHHGQGPALRHPREPADPRHDHRRRRYQGRQAHEVEDRELLGHREPRHEDRQQRLFRLQRRVVRQLRLRGGHPQGSPEPRDAEGAGLRPHRVAVLEHLQSGFRLGGNRAPASGVPHGMLQGRPLRAAFASRARQLSAVRRGAFSGNDVPGRKARPAGPFREG